MMTNSPLTKSFVDLPNPLCTRTVRHMRVCVCLFVARCCVFLTVSGVCGRLDCCTCPSRARGQRSPESERDARQTSEQISKQSHVNPLQKALDYQVPAPLSRPSPIAQYAEERVMRLSAFPKCPCPSLSLSVQRRSRK